MASQQQQKSKTIPLKVLVDRQSNKVVFVEANIDFVETLFSFLSLPLATIVRLTNNDQQQSQSSLFLGKIINLCKYFVDILFSFLSLPFAAIVRLLATINNDKQHQQSESSPFLDNIKNLYQSVQNITSDDIWSSPACKQMLLRPMNPCESMCNKLFLNIDDTESSSEFFVCDSCYNYTTLPNLKCTCGKPLKRTPLDFEGHGTKNVQNGVFLRGSGPMFLVSDDLKILPSSMASSIMMLAESGCSAAFIQLEEVTHNIGKQEPLTNTILKSSSKIKHSPPNQSASAVREIPCTSSNSKMDIKVVQSKSQKKIVTIEDNGDFVDFIFSFLTMPLGSVVKLSGANSFAGCVGNLYKSVENLEPVSVLLNPGIAPQFGCPNQPLNIPHLQLPTYYYEYGQSNNGYNYAVTSNSDLVSPLYRSGPLIALDPRSKEGVVGFVKRTTLYGVGDDLIVKPLSADFCLSYLKELNLPIEDLEVKVISIGEAEALRFLGAFLASKFTLTSGLQDFLTVPKQESTILKVPKQES